MKLNEKILDPGIGSEYALSEERATVQVVETASDSIVRFGDYEVDVRARQLRKRGVRLRLRDQAVDVLTILLEHPGELVTREDLRRRLWPENVVVDFDNSLNSALARLRHALNDSAERPRFVETVPKRGYRFIGTVSRSSADVLANKIGSRPRLLVLPFGNSTGDPAKDYFSDAVTDEVIANLAAVAPERLAVIARTTAMHYKGSKKDGARIARDLRVDYVVEGCVRYTEHRLGISVQLIAAGDQTQLWARRYEAEMRDVFKIERWVAHAIAAQLGITAALPDKTHSTNLEAYNRFIQGRYHFDTDSLPSGYPKARECFEQAIVRDPEFALAYDALAELHYYVGFFGLAPPKEALSAGLFCALRALEIDNTLAETHALLAQYRKQLDFNWAEVDREMREALDLNPASPVVKVRYAMTVLCAYGRIPEAIRELEAALESDPMARMPRVWLGVMHWLARHYNGAIEQANVLVEIDPSYALGHMVHGLAYREMQKFDQAIAAHRRAVELSGGAPMLVGWLGLALAQSGNTAESRALLERLRAMATRGYLPPTSFAWIHFGLGDMDRFFDSMNRAIDARDHMITPIKTYPFLDPIRTDPRYQALLRRMNLEP